MTCQKNNVQFNERSCCIVFPLRRRRCFEPLASGTIHTLNVLRKGQQLNFSEKVLSFDLRQKKPLLPIFRYQMESLQKVCLSPWPPITTASFSLIMVKVWPQRLFGEYLPTKKKKRPISSDLLFPKFIYKGKQQLLFCFMWIATTFFVYLVHWFVLSNWLPQGVIGLCSVGLLAPCSSSQEVLRLVSVEKTSFFFWNINFVRAGFRWKKLNCSMKVSLMEIWVLFLSWICHGTSKSFSCSKNGAYMRMFNPFTFTSSRLFSLLLPLPVKYSLSVVLVRVTGLRLRGVGPSGVLSTPPMRARFLPPLLVISGPGDITMSFRRLITTSRFHLQERAQV